MNSVDQYTAGEQRRPAQIEVTQTMTTMVVSVLINVFSHHYWWFSAGDARNASHPTHASNGPGSVLSGYAGYSGVGQAQGGLENSRLQACIMDLDCAHVNPPPNTVEVPI
jgi:hypothetical protein